MAKVYLNSTKYEINAVFKVEGVVDKHDVIGAIFGQSEGLLGEDLDLRELQKNGKIGRIEITTTTQGGITTGTLVMPSSLDIVETCVLAATIETVDKVGPWNATFRVINIKDKRMQKRERIVERAKELLERVLREEIPPAEEIIKAVREKAREAALIEYGPERLPAGNEIESSDTIIVVEGRADVLNLLKNGIRNVIAIGGGTEIPKTIIELCNKKKAIAFIDGDRGGELILRKLMQLTKIDYVAKAPEGKEVEELTSKEIVMALRRKQALNQEKKEASKEVEMEESKGTSNFAKLMETIKGSLKAKVYDSKLNEIATLEVRELLKRMGEFKGAYAVLLDGIITKRLADAANKAGIQYLVGVKLGKINKKGYKTKLVEIAN